MSYLPTVLKVLDEFGDVEIKDIKIIRSPLPKATSTIANALTFGGFNQKLKDQGYDASYHLALLVRTANGQILVEKIENVNVQRFTKFEPESQRMQILPLPTGLTINILLNKTRQLMGSNKFFGYQALSNNCQKFVSELLTANDLSTPENDKFVLQDSRQLLGDNTTLRKAVNTGTDFKSWLNRTTDPNKGYEGHSDLTKPEYKGYNLTT